MAARNVSPLAVASALEAANQRLPAGAVASRDRELLLETGTVLTNAKDVGDVVVAVAASRPVFLRDLASIVDGPAEPSSYVRFGAGAAAAGAARDVTSSPAPAVTISVAKHKGSTPSRWSTT